jgi:hypothetical protein
MCRAAWNADEHCARLDRIAADARSRVINETFSPDCRNLRMLEHAMPPGTGLA